MLFTSYEFIGFLIIVFLLYYGLPKKCQWPLLLVASYGFYYLANPAYLLFILTTTLSAYVVTIKIDDINHIRQVNKSVAKARKIKWLILGLIINIGILSVTKYTNFIIKNINDLLSEPSKLQLLDMVIPMGISFYTFQTLGYVIDVYRGKQQAQKNPFKLALFVSFFPQLVQGPISRYGDLAPTLFGEHKWNSKAISLGIMRILWGYFKKMVLADRLITAVTTLTQSEKAYTGIYVLVAMLFYAFELYCDFTGGIDITIGIAEAMGIHLAENFNLPFFSKNVKEYWKRWHITMGSWFTDYIFYPISVSKPMLKLSSWARTHLGKKIGKRVTVYLASFAVWFLTGLWHGAAWNFIVWGLLNFAVIMISQEFQPLYMKFHQRFRFKGKGIYSVFEVVRTIFLMSMIRLLDCYRDVPMTFQRIGSMFIEGNWQILWDGSLLNLGITVADYVILILGLFLVLEVSRRKLKIGNIREELYKKPAIIYYGVMALLFLTIIIFGAYGVGYDSTQFIYNQF